MARRARQPLPLVISDLHLDAQKGKYVITDAGITYSMDLEHTRLLKDYFGWYVNTRKEKTVALWYDGLDKETKKQITRSGNLPKEEQDFFPDPEYDE
jgi:hypothetical protein